MSTKSMILDMRLFLGDNNLKRNVASFSCAFALDAQDDYSMQSFTLAPLATKTVNRPSTALTVLQTSASVTVTVTATSGNFTSTVDRLLVVDSDITSLIFANPSTTDSVKITLQQG